MDRGGLKPEYFCCPSNPPSLCGNRVESLDAFLHPPMLPHSCPPARITTQSLMGEGEGGGDLWNYFKASGGLGGFLRLVSKSIFA